MRRVDRTELLRLAAELRPEERQIIETVARFGLLSHSALHSLLFDDLPATGSRQTRRRLAGLVASGVLARLERRIGGKRAGSAGYIYRVGPVGQRLIAYWNGEGLPRGRRVPEPGSLFVRHKLSMADIYVELVNAQRNGYLDLLEFSTEPDCWRVFSGRLGERAHLKPDAFARLGLGAYEDRLFIESDLGTEGRGALTNKVQAYADYFRSGHEQAERGVFPLVLWLVPDQARAELLVDICSRQPAEIWQLFAVVTRDRLLPFLTEDRQLGPGEEPAIVTGGQP